MDKLIQISRSRINSVDTGFKRYLRNKINWTDRLIAITGARGIGKTTLLLQYIKEELGSDNEEVIFVSLDDLWFSTHSLTDFTDEFVKRGGKYLFLDEVHKYRHWSQEIKSIYDYYPGLRIVMTGSSALNIFKGTADLSRRAVMYAMQGMSFREFIQLKYAHVFPVLSLDQILTDPGPPITEILNVVKPVKLFEAYLQMGYYPFFIENEENFHERLVQTVNHVLENDLPAVEKIDFTAIHNIKKLLSVLTESVPFKPNILKLSEKIGISRETLLKYLHLLSKADLLLLLQSATKGISRLNKPEKVFLNNPNLMYALTQSQINVGSLRETFIFNQLGLLHNVTYSGKGDFLVDNNFTIEVGGKNKKGKQLEEEQNAYFALDNVEYATRNKIPLWLFGFLY